MRLTGVVFVRKIAELTLKHYNMPESYVRECTEIVKYTAPKLPSHRQITVKKIKNYYDMYKPWTAEFQKFNHMYEKRLRCKVWVEPKKDWNYFRGDRVEVLSGKDKGKQGFISYIVQERNWVIVRGINMELVNSTSKSLPSILREAPLVIDRQVALVDPVDLLPTKVEWKYDEEGKRVRVSVRSGKILPIPELEQETKDYKLLKAYKDNRKDTKNENLTEITFVPKLKTFEMEIMEEHAIYEDRIPAKTYWY